MKQKKSVLFVLLSTGIILGLIIFGIVFVNFFFSTFIVSPPVTSSRNIDTAISTELVWQKLIESRPIIIDSGIRDSEENFLHVQEDSVILPVWNLESLFSANVALTSFSLSDGAINWENELKGDGTALAIGTNSDGIVTVSIACKGADTMCGEIEIIKHNLISGEKQWERTYSGIYPLGALSIDDHSINIIGGENEQSYYSENSFDVQSGEELPTFVGIQHDVSDFPVKYGAFPLALGYETHEIIGNIVTLENKVVFLSKEESALIIVDKDSREVVGKVDFDGGPFSRRGNDFALDAINDTLVVYLGDSEQLFVFRILP